MAFARTFVLSVPWTAVIQWGQRHSSRRRWGSSRRQASSPTGTMRQRWFSGLPDTEPTVTLTAEWKIKMLEIDAAKTWQTFYCPSGGLVRENSAETSFKTDFLKARGSDGRVIMIGCWAGNSFLCKLWLLRQRHDAIFFFQTEVYKL